MRYFWHTGRTDYSYTAVVVPVFGDRQRRTAEEFRIVGSSILWHDLDDGVSMEAILLVIADQ